MQTAHHADMAGRNTPTIDEGRDTPHAAGPIAQPNTHPEFVGDAFADQAALVIEGGLYAQAFIDRLQAGTAQPGELAMIVAFLRGEMLHGACRVIEKALEGPHHA